MTYIGKMAVKMIMEVIMEIMMEVIMEVIMEINQIRVYFHFNTAVTVNCTISILTIITETT